MKKKFEQYKALCIDFKELIDKRSKELFENDEEPEEVQLETANEYVKKQLILLKKEKELFQELVDYTLTKDVEFAPFYVKTLEEIGYDNKIISIVKKLEIKDVKEILALSYSIKNDKSIQAILVYNDKNNNVKKVKILEEKINSTEIKESNFKNDLDYKSNAGNDLKYKVNTLVENEVLKLLFSASTALVTEAANYVKNKLGEDFIGDAVNLYKIKYRVSKALCGETTSIALSLDKEEYTKNKVLFMGPHGKNYNYKYGVAKDEDEIVLLEQKMFETSFNLCVKLSAGEYLKMSSYGIKQVQFENVKGFLIENDKKYQNVLRINSGYVEASINDFPEDEKVEAEVGQFVALVPDVRSLSIGKKLIFKKVSYV